MVDRPMGASSWRARMTMALGAFALAAAWPTTAFAQEPAATPAPAEAAADDTAAQGEAVIEEITVTAQKRTENVQEVPLAISTLDKQQLDLITAGGVDVKALSGRVPSLTMESSFGRAFPRFYVRGLGNTDFDLNASQPVSMVYDDVVLENAVLKGMPLFDIDRVEVLRGPQGTLFGRNTPAGIVKFDSVKPSQEHESFVRGSYGTFDTVDLQGAWGGPVTDTVSMRVSGLVQSRSDWVENKGTTDDLEGYENWAGRLQMQFDPSEAFSALLNVHGWHVNGTARVFRANMLEKGKSGARPGFDPEVVIQDGVNKQSISSQGAVLTMNYDFGGATLTSVTGYDTLDMFSRGDIDGGFGAAFLGNDNPAPIPFPSESADGEDLDQITQEVRVASNGDGPFGWIAGLYYFDESLHATTTSYNSLAPGNPIDGFAFQDQDTTAWAAFGSLTWKPTDQFKLQGGLRYSNDEKEFSAERPDPTFQTPTVAPITADTDADNVSWDLSGTYFASDNVNFFARVATGFRAPSIQGRILFCGDFAGGTNPATNCVSVADEETVLSYEVGTKTILMDNRLRLNLTLFRFDVDDQQLTAVGGQFNTATLLNADSSTGQGVEADIEFLPVPAWRFNLGVSYNDTEIEDRGLTVGACGGGCTMEDPVVGGLAFVDGNPLPNAPEWIVSGVVAFNQAIGDNLFGATVDVAYQSEKNFLIYEAKEFKDDSFELGARLSYLFANGRYEAALFGRNLTDEVVVQGVIDFNNLTGMINDPRTFGVEFGARF